MMKIPKITDVDIAFGRVDHMPGYDAIPDRFKGGNDPFVRAVSSWFFDGAARSERGLTIKGVRFVAKPGVDDTAALRAIKAVLGSFLPAHAHKEAACAYMLSEWFDIA
jgi:hypothetical protein